MVLNFLNILIGGQKGLNGLNNDGKFKGEIDNMKTNFALSPRFPESDK